MWAVMIRSSHENRLRAFLSLVATTVAAVADPPTTHPAGAVDFLDYFLQRDDVKDEWTLGGRRCAAGV